MFSWKNIHYFWWFICIINCLRILYIKFWLYLSFSSTPPQDLTPIPYPPNFVTSFLQNSLPKPLGVRLSPGVWYIPVRDQSIIKKIHAFFPSCDELPAVPLLRVGLPASLLQGFSLAWGRPDHVRAVSTTEFICMLALLCPENTFLTATHHLWLCQSSHWLLLQWSLNFGRERVREDVSFRAEYHTHFFSAPGQLWISVLLPIWCRKKLLWGGLREALIYVYNKKLLEAGLIKVLLAE